MAKNTYTVSFTVEHSDVVDADTEQEALDIADKRAWEWLPEGAAVIGSRVTETELDGPANYERYQAACQVYYDAKDKHGKDSPEAQAAWKAIPSLNTY